MLVFNLQKVKHYSEWSFEDDGIPFEHLWKCVHRRRSVEGFLRQSGIPLQQEPLLLTTIYVMSKDYTLSESIIKANTYYEKKFSMYQMEMN